MLYMYMFRKGKNWIRKKQTVGSMDVTHLMWKQCPSALRHVCTGRYHCPSVAFQMVCAKTRRIHHVSRPFYGATNDITITLSTRDYAGQLSSRSCFSNI